MTQINRILTNRIYLGEVTFGAGDDPIFIENAHQAILESDTFALAQSNRNKKQTTSSMFKESDYMLTGVLKCSCGASMVGHSAKSGQYHYYACSEPFHDLKCKLSLARQSDRYNRFFPTVRYNFILSKVFVSGGYKTLFNLDILNFIQ